jgi:hypothetical protein
MGWICGTWRWGLWVITRPLGWGPHAGLGVIMGKDKSLLWARKRALARNWHAALDLQPPELCKSLEAPVWVICFCGLSWDTGSAWQKPASNWAEPSSPEREIASKVKVWRLKTLEDRANDESIPCGVSHSLVLCAETWVSSFYAHKTLCPLGHGTLTLLYVSYCHLTYYLLEWERKREPQRSGRGAETNAKKSGWKADSWEQVERTHAAATTCLWQWEDEGLERLCQHKQELPPEPRVQLSGRTFAKHVRGPGFKPQHYKRKRKSVPTGKGHLASVSHLLWCHFYPWFQAVLSHTWLSPLLFQYYLSF